MSFNFPSQDSAPASQAPTNGAKKERDPRTTAAYVNLYLPLTDGTRVKLISDLQLRLYNEKPAEKQLVDLIKSGAVTPEQIMKLIQVEISPARDENAPIEIDLSGLQSAE